VAKLKEDIMSAEASLKTNLNSDLGEAFGPWPMGDDEAMLAVVRSANIACGYHGGDAVVMTRTVRKALERGVSLGAHPGYPDLQGFGRRPMTLSPAEIEAMVAYQIGALAGIAATQGGKVTHVKPHGALSNLAAVDAEVAKAIARAIKGVDAGLIFLAPTGSQMMKAGQAAGLTVASEVFADRNYDDEGNLVPRKHPQAMIHDPQEAADNILRMVKHGVIRSLSGKEVPCQVHSICVHGDEASAVALATHVRRSLEAAGVAIVPLPEVVG
jgi:UPF0271 protein